MDRTGATATLVLAHGAGAGQASPFMRRMVTGLNARGLEVVTFDFPYMAAGRRLPDPAAVLEQAWRAEIDRVRRDARLSSLPLFIGGKSMGGRIASQVAAEGITPPIRGLIFLGYPLHPPGRLQQRRDAHLPAIHEPMLFVQGERDAFGTAEEIRELLPRLSAGVALHAVAAGDHSFKVPARAARTRAAVEDEILDRVAGWIHEWVTG